MTKQTKQVEQMQTVGEKKIEIVIHEMIDKVLENGRKPHRLTLTQDHYNRLIEEINSFWEPGYGVTQFGVVYFPDKQPKRVLNYSGMPVNIGQQTKIDWV